MALRGMGYGLDTPATSGELALLDRLAREPMRTIIDVGANRGAWASAARERWPSAHIHAFEPSAETFANLSARVGSTVTCRQTAIGDTIGTADLHHVPGVDALSSLHRRDLAEHGMEMTEAETVEVVTLDHYCDVNGIDRIDFLKIDVEGHELAVLAGASGLLAEGRVERIQFEFGGTSIDSRSYLRDFVRLLLLGDDFTISRIVKDGTVPLTYSEQAEIFLACNLLAERRRPR